MKVKRSGQCQISFSLIRKQISPYQPLTRSNAQNNVKTNDQYSLTDMTLILDRRGELWEISKRSSQKTRTTSTPIHQTKSRIPSDLKLNLITRPRVILVKKREKMLTKKTSKYLRRLLGEVQICQVTEEQNTNRCRRWPQAMICHLIIY